MGFNFPWAFVLLLLLLPLLWLLRRGSRRTGGIARTFRARPPGRYYFVIRSVLVCVFVVALIAAGARPYMVPRYTGNYLFVTDVSRSMQARYSCSEPSFMERSRAVMHRVLSGLPEGRFGLVAFARLTFPVTQMSYDHAYLHDVIDRGLDVGMIFEATATGINNALEVLARRKIEFPDLYGDVEYAILLSDGHIIDEDSRGELEQSISMLQKAGIRIISVGIGNPGETPVPRMRDGECIDEYLEVDNRTLRIPLRDDLLKYIATETRGEYFGEGGIEELIAFLREETLVRVPAGVEFAEEQRDDISWLFLLAATLGLFGFLLL